MLVVLEGAALVKRDHSASAIAEHVKTTGHNIKWDHFDTLASGKTDYLIVVKSRTSIPASIEYKC